MKDLLLEMKRAKAQCVETNHCHLSAARRQLFSDRYVALILEGKAVNPVPELESGKRGKPKKGKILSMLERFKKYKSEVYLFVDNFLVPFDNNQAERDIRVFKVKEKVTGGFRTVDGAYDFAAIVFYLSTARKHGFFIFDSIKRAFAGNAIFVLVQPPIE